MTMRCGEDVELEAGVDSDATVKAENLKEEDDDSDYTEHGGRKLDRRKKPSKRALFSESQSGKRIPFAGRKSKHSNHRLRFDGSEGVDGIA